LAGVETATKTLDDYALMEAIAAGDQAALAALYDRHSSVVLALALRIVRDRMASEDLLIDVFWELWRKSDRYDPKRGSPLTYLLTLTRSRAIDRRRSAARHGMIRLETDIGHPAGQTEPSVQARGPSHNVIAHELGQRVRAAMGRLDPSQRQAVELSFFDDLSHSQIAERLGKPLGTIKTNIRQGLIHLRESIRMD
jgi:RNA polymerase sigma-70 factor (ECF subfamily)